MKTPQASSMSVKLGPSGCVISIGFWVVREETSSVVSSAVSRASGRRAAPRSRLEAATCRRDGEVDVVGAAGGNIGDDDSVGRVDAGEGVGVGRGLERPIDKGVVADGQCPGIGGPAGAPVGGRWHRGFSPSSWWRPVSAAVLGR